MYLYVYDMCTGRFIQLLHYTQTCIDARACNMRMCAVSRQKLHGVYTGSRKQLHNDMCIARSLTHRKTTLQGSSCCFAMAGGSKYKLD